MEGGRDHGGEWGGRGRERPWRGIGWRVGGTVGGVYGGWKTMDGSERE